MEIKTRYSIGDDVWFVDKRKIQHGCVKEVNTYSAYVSDDKIKNRVEYGIDYKSDYTIVYDEDVYSTKEELIKSL